jgi:hypothetical protein
MASADRRYEIKSAGVLGTRMLGQDSMERTEGIGILEQDSQDRMDSEESQR